jgi:hypothetical protein
MYDLGCIVLLRSYGAVTELYRCRYKHSAPPELKVFACRLQRVL